MSHTSSPPKPLRDSSLLLNYLENAQGYVQDGRHPTEAVIKVARDNGLTPEMAQRVTHILNRSMMQAHRLDCGNGDLTCKMAEIPIAIEENVLASLFPARPSGVQKSASTRVPEPHACYSGAPVRREPWVKQASDQSNGFDDVLELLGWAKPCRDCGTKEAAEAKAATWEDRQQWARDRAAQMLRTKQAEWSAQLALDALTGYFLKPAAQRRSLGSVEHYVKQAAVAEFGQAALDYAASAAGLTEERAGVRNLPSYPVDWQASPFGEILQVKEALELYAAESLALAELEDREPRAPEVVKAAEEEPPDPNAFRLELEPVGEPLLKLGVGFGFAGGMLGGVALEGLRASGVGKTTGELADDTLADLYRPEHQLELDTVRSQVSLANLMRDDDVVSGYDPDEVTGAYNEISEVAPTVSRSMAVLKPYLRRRLTGGSLDSFDVKELIDVENKLRQSGHPQPPAAPGT